MSIVVTSDAAEGATNEALEVAVDHELAEFERYFVQELGNTELVRAERAILKTYLHYKLIRCANTKE